MTVSMKSLGYLVYMLYFESIHNWCALWRCCQTYYNNVCT